jgi:transketolase
MGPYVHKWIDFGWNAIEVDGHDVEALMNAFDKAAETKGKPTIIIAHTVKGKGVSFVENKAEWHGIAPKKEEYERAVKELDAELAKIK